MNQSELALRYWQAYRVAIENHLAAVESNQNGTLIHCFEKVVLLRESELNKIEGYKGA